VLTPEQILDEGREPGERVLVYDADLYYMGSGLAEMLATAGKQVTLVTPAAEPASYTRFTLEQARVVADLCDLGVRMLVGAEVERIDDATMHVDVGPNQDRQEVAFDSLVIVSQRLSDDDLYQELRRRPGDLEEADISGLYRIGDSVAPTFIADAIFDGHRLAREIDSPDPSKPLPFVRERRAWQGDESSYRLPEVEAVA
jgi:dimethylamine/trimethylamine dehydrogenase